MRFPSRSKVAVLAASVLATAAVVGTGVARADDASPGNRSSSIEKTGDGLVYVPIQEPFTTPVGVCDENGNTLQMTNCVLREVVDVDQEIDVRQRQRFFYALTTEDRQNYLEDDAQWLQGRLREVRRIQTGGTIDSITQAEKTLELSRERLAELS